MWIATIVLVPVPLFFWSLDWVYYTRSFMWSVYRIVILTLILAFALPRPLVLRVAGRPDQWHRRGLFPLMSAGYPLFWLSLAGLLLAEICGYGALVTYVATGVAGSAATIFLAILLTRYLADVIGRHRAAAASVTLGLVIGLVRWGIAGGALFLVLRYWGVTGVEIRSMLAYEILGADAVSGRSAITVGRVLAAIAAVAAAWWTSRAMRSLLQTRVYPAYTGLDRGGQAAVNTILHYSFMFLGFYFALVAVRVPLGALTVVLGTLGLGVGLGLQPLFVNFVSGLMILFERHVRVGDIVEVGGQVGEVTNISMRSTSIKTFDNIDLILPNSSFITSEVVNWTYQETGIRGR